MKTVSAMGLPVAVQRVMPYFARIDATIPDTIAAMKAAGKSYDPVTYDGAGHGFMRASEAPDASNANKKARDDAWKRWKSLLAQ